MKSVNSIILFCILPTFAWGSEPVKVGQKFAQLKTQNGRVYTNVTVRTIERYGLKIFHDSGAATIPAGQLPQFRDQFGSEEEIQTDRKQLEKEDSKWHQAQTSGANITENPESKDGTDQEKFAATMQAALEKAEAQRIKAANIEAERRAAEEQWRAEHPDPATVIARLASARRRATGEMSPSGEVDSHQERRDFSSGFATGYKKANPWGFAPFAPFPSLGHDSYEDGYGVGYAAGLADEIARRERYKRR